jgi:hypothetical protein
MVSAVDPGIAIRLKANMVVYGEGEFEADVYGVEVSGSLSCTCVGKE